MRTLTLSVTPAMDGRRVKSLLLRELSMSASLISRVKLRPQGIMLNGSRCRTVDIVRSGDVLCVQVGDDVQKSPFAPVPCSLSVVYEDEDILILDKAAGMACHGEGLSGEPSLGSALAAYWGCDAAFHPVNRLDKGTSGLMAVAKSGYVHELMRRALHTDALRREYLLVCSPPPKSSSGLIDLPIARERPDSPRRCISPSGSDARTEYELLDVRDELALLRARLLTGRTHQIRVHFSAIGSPLLGDALYGSASPLISRPALHSARLELAHPVSGRRLCFVSPLPADMAALFPAPNIISQE